MNYIIVAGYGWSGSSALVDLFKEFENVIVPDVEFRLIKDPYGLSQLETVLTEKWDFINSDAAINDYMWLCKNCATESKSIMSPFGLNDLEQLNPSFIKITDQFIKSLTIFSYEGTNYNREFKRSYWSAFLRRISNAVSRRTNNRINIPYRDDFCYLSNVSKDHFVSLCQKYIDDLFSGTPENSTIVLDQAVSPIHPEDLHFFESAKMIVVDRNPCDIYLDLISHQSLIGKTLRMERSPEKYIEWHNLIRNKNLKDSEQVLHIRFENLVLDYENTLQKILDFIGWDLGKHIDYKKIFNPEMSAKNINMPPNKFCSKDDLDWITERLKDKE